MFYHYCSKREGNGQLQQHLMNFEATAEKMSSANRSGSRPPSASHELKSMLEEQRRDFIRDDTTVLPPAKYLRSTATSASSFATTHHSATASRWSGSGGTSSRPSYRPATAGSAPTSSRLDNSGRYGPRQQDMLQQLHPPPASSSFAERPAGPSRPALYSIEGFADPLDGPHGARGGKGVDDPSVENIPSQKAENSDCSQKPAGIPLLKAAESLGSNCRLTGIGAGHAFSPKPPVFPAPSSSSLSSRAQQQQQSVKPSNRSEASPAASQQHFSSPRFRLDAPLVLQAEPSNLLETISKAVQLVDAYRVLRVGISDEEREALGAFVHAIGGMDSVAQLVHLTSTTTNSDVANDVIPTQLHAEPERSLQNQFETTADDASVTSNRVVNTTTRDPVERDDKARVPYDSVAALLRISSGLVPGRKAVSDIVHDLTKGAVITCSVWHVAVDDSATAVIANDATDESEGENDVVDDEENSHLSQSLQRCSDRVLAEHIGMRLRSEVAGTSKSTDRPKIVPIPGKTNMIATVRFLGPRRGSSQSGGAIAVVFETDDKSLAADLGGDEEEGLQLIVDAVVNGAQVLLHREGHISQAELGKKRELRRSLSNEFSRKSCQGEAALVEQLLKQLVKSMKQRSAEVRDNGDDDDDDDAIGKKGASSSRTDQQHVAMYTPLFFSAAVPAEDALTASQLTDRRLVHYTLRSDCTLDITAIDEEAADLNSSRGEYVLVRRVLGEDEVPHHVQRAFMFHQPLSVQAAVTAIPSSSGYGYGYGDDLGGGGDSSTSSGSRGDGGDTYEEMLVTTYVEPVADSSGSITAIVELVEISDATECAEMQPSSPKESARVHSMLARARSAIQIFSQHFLSARQVSQAVDETCLTRSMLDGLVSLIHEDISDGERARAAVVKCFGRLLNDGDGGCAVDCVALFTVNQDTRSFDGLYEFNEDILRSTAQASSSSARNNKNDDGPLTPTSSPLGGPEFEQPPPLRGTFTCGLEGIAFAASLSKRTVISCNPSNDRNHCPASKHYKVKLKGPLDDDQETSSPTTRSSSIPNFAVASDGKPYQRSGLDVACIRNMISLPLIANGECIAVVQLYNKRDCSTSSSSSSLNSGTKPFIGAPKSGKKQCSYASKYYSGEVCMLETMARHVGSWLRGIFSYEFAVQAGNAAMSLAKITTRPRSGTQKLVDASRKLVGGGGGRKAGRSAAIGELFVDKLHMAGTIRVLSVPQEVLDSVGLPHFDIWSLRDAYPNAKDIVTKLALVLFARTELLPFFKISEEKLANFIIFIREKYRDVPYHSFFHAFDVLQTVYHFMYDGGQVGKRMTKLSQLVVLVTALCHDVDHMGLNNSFHLKSDSPLGILSSATGTQSVLEVHHCNITVEVLAQSECEIFASLPREEEAAAYRLLIDSILGTDMAKHAEFVQQLKQLKGSSSTASCGSSSSTFVEELLRSGAADGGGDSNVASTTSIEDQLVREQERDRLIAMTLIKIADISNVAKPFEISKRWGQAVIEEFSKQGDAEKVTGLDVQPLFDREKNRNLAKTQIGFIKFVAEPFFSLVVANLLPELQYCVDNIHTNSAEWSAKAADDSA